MNEKAFRKFILTFAFVFALGIVIGSVATSFSQKPREPGLPTADEAATTRLTTTTQPATSQVSGETIIDGKIVQTETILQGRCTICHDLESVKASRKSESEWNTTIDRMVSKGAQVSAEEKEALVKHLTNNFGSTGETATVAAAGATSEAVDTDPITGADESADAGAVVAQQTTTTLAPTTTTTIVAAEKTAVQETATPSEQAQTGPEMIYYLLSGGFMVGSGVLLRRKPRKTGK